VIDSGDDSTECKLCGNALVKLEIDRGVSGLPPGAPPPFQAVAYLTFPTMVELQNAFANAAPELLADLSNFTDVEPVFQIAESI
jgi:uncharacterized protein (TIGR02118 family)